MRREFQLDNEQLEFILKACEPRPGWTEPDPEKVNGAWDLIGKHMGFDGRTCEPVPGQGVSHFTAEEI